MSHEDKDILKKLGPFKKNDSFKIPEDYFETFSDKLMNRIDEIEKKKKTGWIIPLKPWISLAAAVIIGFIIFKIGFIKHPDNRNISVNQYESVFDPALSELSDLDLMEYIASNEEIKIDGLDEDLTMGLSPDDLESLVLF